MQAAIVRLEIAVELVETNERVLRQAGRIAEANSLAVEAVEIRRALEVLREHLREENFALEMSESIYDYV